MAGINTEVQGGVSAMGLAGEEQLGGKDVLLKLE